MLLFMHHAMKVGYRDTTSPILNMSTREKNDKWLYVFLYTEFLREKFQHPY